MSAKTIFAGFGGQGVLMMGYCLATAGMSQDKHVTYLPAYGAEVRGGTCNCTICVSTDEIASPIASQPEVLVAMNEPSLVKFQNVIKSGGVCISNATLISKKIPRNDVTEYRVPAGSIAEKIGSARSANMVILGALAAATDIVPLSVLQDTVASVTAKKNKAFAVLNEKAIKAGYKFVMDEKKKAAAKKKKKKKTSRKAAEKSAKKKNVKKK